MRRVRIQFVESKAWKVVWLVTAVFLLSIAGFTGWQVWQQRQIRQGLQVELSRLQAELRSKAAPVAPAVNSRGASERAVQRLLQWDWNRVYDSVENPELATARLVQMSVDAETGSAWLEYELETLDQAAGATAALNAGEASRPWQLERMSTVTNAGANPTGRAKVQAIWRARLD